MASRGVLVSGAGSTAEQGTVSVHLHGCDMARPPSGTDHTAAALR